MKKWTKILAATVSCFILVASITGGIVLADEPDNSNIQPRQIQNGWRMQSVDAITDLIGLTADEIHDQRLAGASLVEIAATQGVSESELVNALIGGITTRLGQAVTDGKITQENADNILSRITERTTAVINSTEATQFKARRVNMLRNRLKATFQRGVRLGNEMSELPDLLGLTPSEIHEQRLAGASLVEIAALHGISESDLEAELTAGITERLAQSVVDGKIEQEQADQIMAKINERVTVMVNNTDIRQTSPNKMGKLMRGAAKRGFARGLNSQ